MAKVMRFNITSDLLKRGSQKGTTVKILLHLLPKAFIIFNFPLWFFFVCIYIEKYRLEPLPVGADTNLPGARARRARRTIIPEQYIYCNLNVSHLLSLKLESNNLPLSYNRPVKKLTAPHCQKLSCTEDRDRHIFFLWVDFISHILVITWVISIFGEKTKPKFSICDLVSTFISFFTMHYDFSFSSQLLKYLCKSGPSSGYNVYADFR